ncbi:tRNA (adenosine(37)-N6)-threonylcarbamoyltransferase complex dimerization subunit type 1 TsaB [bacterium]|nr:tRNA (adenosine(37)-N6)-threonylcarbamoyltransferase complex dimerization subunit type 1 TsaB [bacterium]
MYYLGIDTSSSQCDVALIAVKEQGIEKAGQATLNMRFAHSEKIIGLIDETLNNAKIDRTELKGISVAIGPGSFTGLRVGLSVAKGLCFALDIPLAGVPTLDAIAQKLSYVEKPLWVAVTARKNEFYCAVYSSGERISDIEIYSIADLGRRMTDVIACVSDNPEIIRDQLLPEIQNKIEFIDAHYALADAYYIAMMGYRKIQNHELEPIETLVPMYVQAFKGVMAL